MKLDVAIPHTLEIPALSQPWELALGHKEVIGAMKLADELGFRKCMLGEHFLIPEDHLAASGAYWHHGTVFLAGVAGADRKSVVEGKSVSVGVDIGGRRILKQKIQHKIKD